MYVWICEICTRVCLHNFAQNMYAQQIRVCVCARVSACLCVCVRVCLHLFMCNAHIKYVYVSAYE